MNKPSSPDDAAAEVSLYCRSTKDGDFKPPMTDSEAEKIENQFEPDDEIADRYRLIRLLGAGGMGQVFLARDDRLDRQVAIKVVANEEKSETLSRILEREARLAANLNHPGIAVVYDCGSVAGRPYVVFEFVDGQNLRERLRSDGPFGLERTRELLMPLARALDFAHGNDVIHRDLKPENICQSANGECKILDFGVAVNTRVDGSPTSFAGTPAYAAPEQLDGRQLDGRTDQYALACVVFELISGRRVFVSKDRVEVVNSHASDLPPRLSTIIPDIPLEVDDAVFRALSKSPDQRFDSCQEFAEALGCEPGRILERRLKSEPIHFFISQVSEDSIFARRLARTLDRHGYKTWYYQRDALPGLSLFAQTNEQITNSAGCILLISRAAIGSSDFSREVKQAHRCGCSMFPVLVDLSLQEFESIKPGWKTMLGPITKFEAGSNDHEELAKKIHLVAAEKLGNGAIALADQKQDDPPARFSGQTWATDAYQIDINELPHVVFENDVIKEFLQRKNKFFISATKGLGKTLLLTYKRHQLTQEHKENSIRTTMVPAGRPYLDFMGDLRMLSEKYEKPLEELSTAKRIWSLALRIASISYQENMIAEDEQFELEAFPQRLQRALRGNKMEPTLVFKELTALTVSELNRMIDETEGFLDQKLRQVHSSLVFFIDKVDQAIKMLGSRAWINVQAGLIEAAWDLMNANTHIKVYASIRQEAFCNYESDIKSNLRGAVSILRYSDDELLQMMNRLSQCYEGKESFKDFVGLNVVNSGRRPFLEDSFSMIRRYTFGRPRDLVLIASEMSSLQRGLNEKKYCDTVRESAAVGLVPTLFDEAKVFLSCLHDRDIRMKYLSWVPFNILTREQIWLLTAKFNKLPPETFADLQPIAGLQNPFLDLYVAGLLGYLRQSPDDDDFVQTFRQPEDLIGQTQFKLPVSTHYLLHPALERFVETAGDGQSFHASQQIRIGHGLHWRDCYPAIAQIESTLANVKHRKFVHRTNELLTDYQQVNVLSEQKPDYTNSSDCMQWLEENASEDSSAEVVLLLNELFSNGSD